METTSTLAAPAHSRPSGVARKTWFRAVGAIVGALLASGTLMRVGAMSPSNLLGMTTHFRLFSLHSALTLVALFFLLVYFAPSRTASSGLRVALGAVQTIGAAIVVLSGESRSALALGCGVCLVATLLFAVLVLEVKSWVGVMFLIATLGQLGAWAGTMAGWSQVAGATLYPLVLAVVVGPSLPPHGANRPLLLVGVVTYLLARSGVRFFGLSPLALVALIAGLGVGVALFRSAKNEKEAWPRWSRRVEAGLFIEAIFLTAFLGLVGNDVHLKDTLFPIGATHLEGFVLVFALLRALESAGRTLVGWAGFSFAAVGAHVFCWGSVVLGSRGMPQRYARYLDDFVPLQTITSAGALVMAVGVLACVAARRSSPGQPAPKTV